MTNSHPLPPARAQVNRRVGLASATGALLAAALSTAALAAAPPVAVVSVQQPLPTAGQPMTLDRLEIADAERVSIKFQGLKDLTGDFRVAQDQTISVPVLGRISVAGLDAAGLERSLAERVSRLTGRQAYVTVEVSEWRPIFVSGFVAKPGRAPWTPGTTVLQVVTLSGGAFRGEGNDAFDTKARRAVDDQKRIFATIARLEAEKAGADKIDMPPRLIALVGRAEAESLLDSQQTSFLSRRAATMAQIDTLQRSIALARQERDTLLDQKKHLEDQLGMRKTQYVRLKALYDKQFLRLDRLSEEEVRISELEEKTASVGVSIARADGTLTGLERDLVNYRQDRQALIDTDLLKLERDAAQLQLEIDAAGPLPRRQTTLLSDRDGGGGPQDDLTFEIVRQLATGAKTLPADRNTPLRPGDMVIVGTK